MGPVTPETIGVLAPPAVDTLRMAGVGVTPSQKYIVVPLMVKTGRHVVPQDVV